MDATALPSWVAFRAAAMPDQLAIIVDGERWSYAELERRVAATAGRLTTLGVAPGDRVATLLRNGAAAVELAHAVARAGAVLVPLNVRLAAPALVWQLRDVAPRVLLVHDATAALAGELAQAIPELDIVPAGALARLTPAALPSAPAVAPDAPHTIIYTSGTTGHPKGALLTHGNHFCSAIGSSLNLGVHTDDRWLACLPLFHVGGLSILLRAAIYGTAAEVHANFDAAAVNRAIDDGVTIVSVVAVMLARMLDERGDRPWPTTLRAVLLGGGPAPRSLLERCAASGIPVVQTYGMTETASQAVTLPPADALRKLGSAGRALYPNELRVGTPDAALPPNAEGEILIRGPIVTPGYAGRPDESARALAGGWLHTGDIGRLDDDGYLYVLDRRDDLIVSGGENVYPAEVENALLAQPGVAEAGVIGVADDRWGQRVAAVVRLHEGAAVSADTLRAAVRATLGGYRTPAEIRFASEPLPRTAAGKLLRRLLRDGWPA